MTVNIFPERIPVKLKVSRTKFQPDPGSGIFTFVFLCSFFSYVNLFALPVDTVILTGNTLYCPAGDHTLVDHGYDASVAARKLMDQKEREVIDPSVLTRSGKAYWVIFIIKNNSPEPIAAHIDAYMEEAYLDDRAVTVCRDLPCIGELRPPVARPYSANILIEPGEHVFLARISHYDLPEDFRPRVSAMQALYDEEYFFDYSFFLLISVFMGAVLLLGMLALGIFVVGKDRAFLWYGIFCTLLGLNSLRILTEHYVFLNENPIYITFIYFKHFSAVALYASYAIFAFYFVNADMQKPWVYLGVRIFVVLCILSVIPEIVFLVQEKYVLSFYYYFNTRNFLGICSIVLIILISRYRREPFVKFILIGSSILITAEMISNFLPKGIDSMVGTAGAFLELGVFALGLSYRVRIHYTRRLQLLNENIEKTRIIADLQVEKSRLNMTILQSQMNPHFIFNSLNSINRYILKNDRDEASYFLSRFSRLMRLILDNSVETSIKLSEELTSVQLYLELESLRFNGSFTFQINIEEGLDTHGIIVPPLILQPFVENSVKHGFVNRSGSERLVISVSRYGSQTLISIEDNGIGRNASVDQSWRLNPGHKSRGLKITTDRIRNFSLITNQPCDVFIKDIDTEGQTGTIVGIII